MLANLIDKILKPEVLVAILMFSVLVKLIAHVLYLIGKHLIPGEDFVETSASKLKRGASFIIKLLNWYGVGNNKSLEKNVDKDNNTS